MRRGGTARNPCLALNSTWWIAECARLHIRWGRLVAAAAGRTLLAFVVWSARQLGGEIMGMGEELGLICRGIAPGAVHHAGRPIAQVTAPACLAPAGGGLIQDPQG